MEGLPVRQRLKSALEAAFEAAAFTLSSLPALMLAWLCLRIAEAIHAAAAGVPHSTLFGVGIGNDTLSLLRYGFVFLLGSLPLAFIASQRLRIACLGTLWSALLCADAALLQYHWVAGVPLGADLFAYSGDEVVTVMASGWQASPLLLAALVLGLGTLWSLLLLSRHELWPRASGRMAGIALAASLAAFAFLPARMVPAVVHTDADLGFVINKAAFSPTATWPACAARRRRPATTGSCRARRRGTARTRTTPSCVPSAHPIPSDRCCTAPTRRRTWCS